MLHSSHAFQNTINSFEFSDDTIVFFGFPSDNNAEQKVEQFISACEEKGIVYKELAFAPCKQWHYEKCFEIGVKSEDELRVVEPIIALFGSLNTFADADETVVVLRTREEIKKIYELVAEASALS